MTEATWRWLTTISDEPSAAALARVLEGEGIAVRVVSEAHLFGQASPCRIFVNATQSYQAQWTLSQRQFSDEELLVMATGEAASPQKPR
ncbi:MAG: hypothetical protein ACREU2_07405 [Steroidobacteraceae bacterium]